MPQVVKQNARALARVLGRVIGDGNHSVHLVQDGIDGFYLVDKNRCFWIRIGPKNLRVHLLHVDTAIFGDVPQVVN